ncbi:MAG TPA: prolyl oligopeptidase family serine peptidase [Lacipirellula sp.]
MAGLLSTAHGEHEPTAHGDQMINAYLAAQVEQIAAKTEEDFADAATWQKRRERYKREYLYMLGLDPMPERTPLHPTITGSMEQDDYVVDNLHFQSRPGLYVTGNLYRPKQFKLGKRLPAVLYVCGHSNRGRDGNKSGYQSHGIWFARHGYICLTIDTLQLGEIAGAHHGTYKLNRWSWLSRGYTPAGVEAWNGIRAIDYLVSRPDVDPEKIAVTGISGGGAATIWIAAADERVKVAVPVSGISDLRSYVCDHVIEGHCDCMFLHNAYRWPWARIPALIAPRPLLVVNSDQDPIFPMSGNHRLANQLEQAYRLYGAGDMVDVMTSVGDHAYRGDIRRAVFRFINMHLKNDPRPVTDSEIDIHGDEGPRSPVIDPRSMRVFPESRDLPADALNADIDEHFVPVASPELPYAESLDRWRERLIRALRKTSLSDLPATPVAAIEMGRDDDESVRLSCEEHVEFRLKGNVKDAAKATRLLLVVCAGKSADASAPPPWLDRVAHSDERVLYVLPRGVGPTRWTRKNPPNYVERSHVLVGTTVDTGRLRDVLSAVEYVRELSEVHAPESVTIRLAGKGAAGVLAGYAAALDDEIAGAVLLDPHPSHTADDAPQFLNILRTCDIADVLGLMAPRSLTIVGGSPDRFERTKKIYSAAGQPDRLHFE